MIFAQHFDAEEFREWSDVIREPYYLGYNWRLTHKRTG